MRMERVAALGKNSVGAVMNGDAAVQASLA
jgi:hypothetical protein